VTEPDPTAALVAEACQRSDLLWVHGPARRAQPVWHAWHDGAVLLVVGGEEQPDPVPAGATEVEVSARSKEAQTRLVTFTAAVEEPAPGTQEWADAAGWLKAARLNAQDPDPLLERWAASSRILRLTPTGQTSERPGDYDDDSGALPPAPTPAVTVRRRPFHLGGRRPRRRRRGS
jgi:hypothetical protein